MVTAFSVWSQPRSRSSGLRNVSGEMRKNTSTWVGSDGRILLAALATA